MTTLAEKASDPHAAVSAPRLDVPARAEGVQLLGTQRGSGYRVPPSLVQRADGQVVQLTPLLYATLSAIDGRRTEEEIGAAVSRAIRRTVVAEDVRTLVDKHLRPLGLLCRADGSQPAVRKANPLLALRFRYVVSDPARTRRLTAPFAVLFHPVAVIACTLSFAAVAYWVLFRKGLAAAAYDAFASPGLLLAVFGITVLSAGFHEFGHAAALRRGGGTPGAMGMGLYLVWPAFFTDVTDSYRLGRGARLRTDLGGLYFNALVAVVMFGAWTVCGWDGLLLVIAAQILQMLRQLPPLLRFDGYHVLADITGVPDLYQRIKPTLVALWPTRWRDADARALKPWARAVVTLWVLLVVPLLLTTAMLMIVALPRILATAGHSLAAQWALFTDRWSQGGWLGVGAKALALVAVVIPALGVVYIVARMVRQVVTGTFRRTRGRPVQRTAAAVLAAAVVAALAWAWWPRGNYRAIEPGERGVVQQLLTSTTGPAPVAQRPVTGRSTPTHPTLREGRPATATTVWPADGAPLPTPAHPQLAMVLTPRDSDKPTWVFPFNRPAAPGLGDNQALAIATKDGTTVYDVAFALVYAGRDTVLNRNEAYAFASCTGCTAVAISFQVVLIVGHAQVIAPQNISAAVAYNCIRCVTAAVAVQLDVTVPDRLDASTAARLAAQWSQIREFSRHLGGLSVAEIRAQIVQYERQILQIVQPSAPSSSPAAGSSVGGSSSGAPMTSSPAPGSSASLAGSGSAAPEPSSGPSPSGGTPVSEAPPGTASASEASPSSVPTSAAPEPSPTTASTGETGVSSPSSG